WPDGHPNPRQSGPRIYTSSADATFGLRRVNSQRKSTLSSLFGALAWQLCEAPAIALAVADRKARSIIACGAPLRPASVGHPRISQLPNASPLKPQWQRPLYLVAGCLSLVIGIIALVVPLIPGVVFLVLATACFSRSSPAMEKWLTTHPRFGKLIRNWQAGGVVPRGMKWIITLSMVASFLFIFLETQSRGTQAVVAAVLIAVLVYVWTRPEKLAKPAPVLTRTT
ncbi:YbaN family protein, partial [Methylobacterium sp.]|uniref:YbaN family protein n=1 Tax=Methylobacterium sp. TaxID=409 RepID=UPI0025CB8F80